MNKSGNRLFTWGPRLLWVLAVGYLAVIVNTHLHFYSRTVAGLPPMKMEYAPNYGASLQLRDSAPESLHDPQMFGDSMIRAVRAMYPAVQPVWLERKLAPPWLYPPTFTFLLVPLALLPYWWSYFFWNVATALPYLLAIRRILPSRIAWPFALTAPPVFYNALQGQTGFLTGGLIGLGLAMLRSHPTLAGVLIGLASVKPHFGLLIPVALVAGGHWRVAISASITVMALFGFSVLAFGTEPWVAYLGSAAGYLQGFEAGTYKYVPMTSVLALFAISGADMAFARAAQFASLLLMIGLVAWTWWRGESRPATHPLQCAILCLATPLSVPMAYIYDLVLIVPALAWIGLDLHARGGQTREWSILIVATAALLAVVTLADSFQVQIAPLILLVLLALGIHRFRRALHRSISSMDGPAAH